MSEIAERVKNIIVDKLGVEPEKVTEEAAFVTDLGADSLDTVEPIADFEKNSASTFPTKKLKKSKPLATQLPS